MKNSKKSGILTEMTRMSQSINNIVQYLSYNEILKN